MPALPLPDVRAGDHVVRSHVLPEVRGVLPPGQMPVVQGALKTKGGEGHEEQRAAHQCCGEVLPRRDEDEVPNTGEAQSQPLHGSFTRRKRGSRTR